jgi:hypothetical protein
MIMVGRHDIAEAATLLLAEFGPAATIIVDNHVHALLDQGDVDNAALWEAVGAMVDQLAPTRQPTVH